MKCKTEILKFRINTGSVWIQLQFDMQEIHRLESNRNVGNECNCNFACVRVGKKFLNILII